MDPSGEKYIAEMREKSKGKTPQEIEALIVSEAKKNGFTDDQVSGLLELPHRISSACVTAFISEFIKETAIRHDVVNYKKILQSVSADTNLSKTDNAEEPEVTDKVYFARAYKRALKELSKVKSCPHAGYQEFDLTDYNVNLRYQMRIVPSDYKIELYIDEKYIKPLFSYLDKFITMARDYYLIVLRENPRLAAALADFAPTVDINAITIQKYNRTLYLDETYPARIGVNCEYYTKQGRMIKSFDEVKKIMES